MTQNTLTAALSIVLLGAVALAGCKKDEPAATTPAVTAPATTPAPAPAPAPAPVAAVTVTGVDLGTAVGADNRVTTPSTTFAKTDTIHASVATSAANPSVPATGQLTARWTYQDGQLVDELPQDYNFTGTGNTVFQVSNPDGWPVGTYKLEVLLDGEVVQTREFQVQ